MDILEANFPHLFPSKQPGQQVPKVEQANLLGDRGVANDEASPSRAARECDEVFIDCLLNHLKLVDLKVLKFMDPRDSNHDGNLEEALALASQIIPEVERLRSHLELFSNELQEHHFLMKAGQLAYRSRELLDLSEQLGNLNPPLHKQRDGAAADSSADPQTKVKTNPWARFAEPSGLKDLPFVKEVQKDLPDMKPVSGCALPPAMVMIAERNKKRQDWYMGTMTNPPADVLALQHNLGDLVKNLHVVPGLEATHQRGIPLQPPMIEEKDAFDGRHAQISEMGRFMAHMEKDVTTLPGQAQAGTTFRTTFLSEEGKRARKEAALAKEDEEDYPDLT